MRNKPYVAALVIPAVLLLFWALSLWWNENNVASLFPGAAAIALLFAARRVARAESFTPTKQARWDSSRPESVNRWLDSRADEDETPVTR